MKIKLSCPSSFRKAKRKRKYYLYNKVSLSVKHHDKKKLKNMNLWLKYFLTKIIQGIFSRSIIFHNNLC
jgi:hypothetical protein